MVTPATALRDIRLNERCKYAAVRKIKMALRAIKTGRAECSWR
jgi:hypothetical protein